MTILVWLLMILAILTASFDVFVWLDIANVTHYCIAFTLGWGLYDFC